MSDEDVTGPYPASDGEEGVMGPASGYGDVVGPYPGSDDDGVIGPYPGSDDDDVYPNTDAQYADAAVENDAGTATHGPDVPGPSAPSAHIDAEPPPQPHQPHQPPQPPQPPHPAAPPSNRWKPPEWCKEPVMHQPKLEAYENGRCARTMSLLGARYFILGRNGAQADIVVADGSISRAHAVLVNSSGSTFLQDLDSAHGTFYDEIGRTMHVPQLGVRLGAAEEPIKLVEGSTFRLGTFSSTVFRVVGLEHSVVARWQPPAWAAAPDLETQLEVRSNSVSNPYLQHLADDGADIDETLPLRTACTHFGRSAAHVEVVIRDDSLSRQHAAIVHSAERESFLIDLGSASGTFVDGERLEAHKLCKLTVGAVLSFGACAATYTFRVVSASQQQQQQGEAASKGGKRKRG
jgi:pSer/pThr/pTyr-binding forkhead associated (FHA) protein